VKKIIRFLYHKIKNRKLLSFSISSRISKNSVFEGRNKIYPEASFSGTLGFGSYIGPNSNLLGSIGRYTSIAPFVKVINGTHPTTVPYVSTSPVFYSLNKQNGTSYTDIQRFDEFLYCKETKSPVIIGNDCWIGERVMIIGGVNIAHGAIVLAGAVVTKDIPPYAIVGGVPGKIIKYRYDSETIQFLLKYEWWNKDEKWLKKNVDLMNNIDLLIKMKLD